MKKILFIDRDGTIIKEPHDEQVDAFEKLEFLPEVIQYLRKISEEMEFELVMITNQDGLGTDAFPEDTFWPTHQLMLNILQGEGIVFDEILIDKTFPHENANTRKPGTGLLTHYIKGDYDLANSFVLGDRTSDLQLAKNLGAQGIFISKEKNEDAVLCTDQWSTIYSFLKNKSRKGNIQRETKETQIQIELNLDGSGEANINTGLAFFDHMLDQLARHGGIDLSIQVKGDLEIDEHHTIEDTALALGKAFNTALGLKKGINRYGFLLPMDDCLSQVAIDFGGRPWLVWEADFKREKIGDMPTEMFYHFFKSFSDEAKCNLNIKAEGNNEHHKIESIFKAWAKAIKGAISFSGQKGIPSTKGIL